MLRPLLWEPDDIKDVQIEGMGKRNSHQDCIPERNRKSSKWILVLLGWILLLEKEPLTYMGIETTLYNMEMEKPRYGRNMILLK